MQSEQQQRIMGYFIEEAKDHLNTIEQGLLNLQGTIEDSDLVHEVFRAAHSVKGGAAMLGIDSIQKTAHRLEDYFKVLKECPVKVDQKLESLFLRVFDTLQELLEQLQGPFGLTDDNAIRIMGDVEPVLGQLNAHLKHLVDQSGGAPPAEVDLTTQPASTSAFASASSAQPVSAAEDSALRLYFQSDVPAQLRTMLQLLKQAETPEARQQLQNICVELAQAGDSFDLPPAWGQLATTARRAIANPENSFKNLAPAIIKDFKQAQERVLSGNADTIVVSDALQSLAPVADLTPDITDADDLLKEANEVTDPFRFNAESDDTDAEWMDEIGEIASSDSVNFDDVMRDLEFEEPSTDPSTSSDSASEITNSDSAESNFRVDNAPIDFAGEHDNSDSDEALDEAFEDIDSFLQVGSTSEAQRTSVEPDIPDANPESLNSDPAAPRRRNQHTGPEVGTAELNSLADLFENEAPELGMDWHEEVIQDSSDLLDDDLELGESSDFSDLLFDDRREASGQLDQTEEDVSELLSITDSEDQEVTTSANSGDLDEFFEMGSADDIGGENELSESLAEETADSKHEMSELDNLGAFFSQTGDEFEDADAAATDELEANFALESDGELDFDEILFDEAAAESQPSEVASETSGDDNTDWFVDTSSPQADTESTSEDSSAEDDWEAFFDNSSEAAIASDADIEEDLWASDSSEPFSQTSNASDADSTADELDIDEVDFDLETSLHAELDFDLEDGSAESTEDVEDSIDPDLNLDFLDPEAFDLSETDEQSSDDMDAVIALGASDSDAGLDLQDLLQDEHVSGDAIEEEDLQKAAASESDVDLDQLFESDESSSHGDTLNIQGIEAEMLSSFSSQLTEGDDEVSSPDSADRDLPDHLTDQWADTDLSDDIWDNLEESATQEGFEEGLQSDAASSDLAPDLSADFGDFWNDEADISTVNTHDSANDNAEFSDFSDFDLDEALLDDSDEQLDELEFDPDELLASDGEDAGAEDLDDSDLDLGSLIDDAPISEASDFESADMEPLALDEAAIALDDMLESNGEDALADWDLNAGDSESDDFDAMLNAMSMIDGEDGDSDELGDDPSAASQDYDFDDLDAMLAASEEGNSGVIAVDESLDEADASAEISQDDDESLTFAEDGGMGDFDDLEALLDEPVAAPEPSNLEASQADYADTPAAIDGDNEAFEDLEALLDDAPISTIPSDEDGASEEDDFADLEKLLEDADQKLGGSPTAKAARGPSPGITRRPVRRPSSFTDQTMRVPVKNLDNLNNLVGELVVNRNSLEQSQERLRQFLDNLLYQVQQLSDVGQRMRDLYERSLLESSLLSSRRTQQIAATQAANAGSAAVGGADTHATGASFDALEMDRFTGFHTLSQEMIELIVRVREAASDIDFVVDESDQITRMFRQVTTQLQEGLTRSRMVPFAQAATRLPRAVRDISIKCGKQAELVIEGKDTLIDKMILEQLYDPMTHLVNNAITHGIETPEERQAIGKQPTGTITIRVFHQGNQTIISVTDDGAGIDPTKVKRKAIERGLILPEEADDMSDLETYDLLFHHGFSTRDQADDFAGRGVGMDVVRTSLNEIRGVINIDSAINQGTTFTIRLPLTLSISKALLCVSNRARIAFPMDGVEDMLDVPRERIQDDAQERPCIQWRDIMLPFQPLADLLKYNRSMGRGSVYGGNQEDDVISVVVLRSAGNYLALQVDQVLGEQEIVIKQLEAPVPKPAGIAGATVLGDGRIMPIADVLELIDLSMGRIRRESGSSLWDQDAKMPPPPARDAKSEPTVLIVDDSITVRELLSMTFSKVGYRVEQARDGQEAWEKLKSGLPCDLVFCDIEMPRMDGLELLSRLQKDGTLKDLPIAMLTSRGADRHRQMAVQLGAKGYFTKPYLEEALLDAAQRMLNGEVLVSV